MNPVRESRCPHWAWLLVPLVMSSFTRGFWAPDEPRYAEVAREVFAYDSFLVMHLCGDVYPDKPPLLFWLAGLLGWLTGWSAFGMRLVSVVATAGSAALIATLARRAWGEREAALAPVFYLGFALVAHYGPRLQIDPLLAVLCLASLVLATTPDRSAAAAGEPLRVDPRALLLAGLCTGLAAMAKGPVAWLHVGLPLLLWRIVPSARQGLPAPASRGRRLTAIALAILPVALWATAAVMQEPGLARDLFYGQHLERAVDGSRHGGPLWRHLERVPLQLMPWTPIVIAALFMRDRDPARRRFLLWAGSLFVFFSIVPSKRDLYLLPIYPAFALLTAHWMVLRLHAQRTHASDAQDYHVGSSAAQSLLQGASWVSRAQVGVFIVAGTLLSIASVWGHWQLDKAELRAIALPVLPFGLLLLASGLYAAHVARRKGDWFRPMVIGWTLALTVLAITVLPKLDANKSAESLALVVMERPERPVVVHCIGVRPEGFRFYGSLGRGLPAAFASELPRKKDRQGADFLALIRADRWEATENKRRKDLEIVYRQFVGSKEVLLVAVRSGP